VLRRYQFLNRLTGSTRLLRVLRCGCVCSLSADYGSEFCAGPVCKIFHGLINIALIGGVTARFLVLARARTVVASHR
jgi:hypothetical protein